MQEHASHESSSHSGEDIAEFGYKQEMKRDLGWYTSFSLAFGFVSIATGIFTTYGAVIKTSGIAGIWAWPLVVIGQLATAFMLGALAARVPVSGYAYQWMSRLANPILGWAIGWVSFTFLAVVVLAVDYTIPDAILPNLLNYEASSSISYTITACIVLVQVLLVLSSTKVTQVVNNVAVTIQLIGMISLTVLLYVVGYVKDTLDFSLLFTTAPIPVEGYFNVGTFDSAGPFAMAFLLGAFTIVGFESAANLAEEIKDPARTVPKAMWQAVVSLGVLGFLFIVAVSANAIDPLVLAQSATPVADVITNILGVTVGKFLLVLVVISIFSCGLVITLTGVRLTWAMSRDKRFPGWQFSHKINPKTITPVNAAIVYLVVVQAELFVFSYSTDTMFVLFSAGTLLPAIIYMSSVLLYIFKRKTLPASKGFDLGAFEVPVMVVAMVWLIWELLLFRDTSFRELWMYVAVMFGIGVVYLSFLLIKNGKDSLTMPELKDIDKEMDERVGL